MHDIDRTSAEFEPEMEAYESDYEEEYGEEYEYGAQFEGPFDEAEEMELAAELLEIGDEAELDQFLGKLFKKAGRALGKFVRSPVGRSLGGMLKGVVKKALPVAGGALGSLIPIPGVGTAVGTALGSAIGNSLEMELEGMEPEDQEFEAARRIVRIAGAAAKQAALSPPAASASQVAKTALLTAAKQHVPGFQQAGGVGPAGGRSGRWVRRGRKIILFGV